MYSRPVFAAGTRHQERRTRRNIRQRRGQTGITEPTTEFDLSVALSFFRSHEPRTCTGYEREGVGGGGGGEKEGRSSLRNAEKSSREQEMQGDKELEGLKISLRLSLQLQCVAGSAVKGRRYCAPCMLQESPSLSIVLMCLVERRSPRMEERWDPGWDWAQGGGREVEGRREGIRSREK